MAILVFLVGLAAGGLVNLVAVRLPQERGVGGWPRCTRCGRPLAAWQLIPLLGWLIQGGRARCCGRRLDWIFPLVDLGAAAALLVFYLREGPTVSFVYLSFVTLVLLLTAAIDWRHRMIYTLFVLLPALLVLAVSAFVPEHSLLNALIGALVAGFVFALLFLLAQFLFPTKAAPFGLGDVYLSIFLGAAVGLTNLMPALFWGMLLAGIFSAVLLLMRRAGRPNVPEYISYGSFLCVGAIAYLMVAM